MKWGRKSWEKSLPQSVKKKNRQVPTVILYDSSYVRLRKYFSSFKKCPLWRSLMFLCDNQLANIVCDLCFGKRSILQYINYYCVSDSSCNLRHDVHCTTNTKESSNVSELVFPMSGQFTKMKKWRLNFLSIKLLDLVGKYTLGLCSGHAIGGACYHTWDLASPR